MCLTLALLRELFKETRRLKLLWPFGGKAREPLA